MRLERELASAESFDLGFCEPLVDGTCASTDEGAKGSMTDAARAVEIDDLDSDRRARDRRLGFGGTAGGISSIGASAAGRADVSWVGVREPVEDAVGGGSRMDKRCNADSVGEGCI